MAEKKVTLPVSVQEFEVLKKAFKGNDQLLLSIRSLFLGLPISDTEKKVIRSVFSDPLIYLAFRKKIYPNYKDLAPLGQLSDYWIGSDQKIFGQSRDAIYQEVNSKQRCFEMFDQSFKLLKEDGMQVNLDFNPVLIEDPLQVQLLARNLYIRAIEGGLNYLKLAMDQEQPTPSEQKKKSAKDSAE